MTVTMPLLLPLKPALLQSSMPREVSEAVLLAQLRNGGEEAFRWLVERHQRPVFGLLHRMGFDQDTVEDLAQEAFLKAWRSLPGFRGDCQIATWLYRIVYRQALQHIRSRERQFRLQDEAQTLRDVAETPLPDAARTELRLTLDSALSQLPAPQRLALGLYYFQEQSYEEVAAIMQLPLNTVKTHIRRGKLRLRELLQERQA
ncbi:MAG: ECF RNA polymerase sigma factor SigW [bacterium]|nr:ECF RNA polymerase sigma factor SigW [bacterium]